MSKLLPFLLASFPILAIAQVNTSHLTGTTGNIQTNIDAKLSTNSAFVDSRYNLVVNPSRNSLSDNSTNSDAVTITATGGRLPNKSGTDSGVIASQTITSGTIYAGIVYYVNGTTGTVTYNSVAYSPGNTFTGVYSFTTFVATGDCTVRNNIARQADSSYSSGGVLAGSILGGYDHIQNQVAGTIAGGGHNQLRSPGSHTFIGGGSFNIGYGGNYAVIAGGTLGQVSQDYGIVVGGAANLVTSDITSSADYSAILSGNNSQIRDVGYGTVLNGSNNRLLNPTPATPTYLQILNGASGAISGGSYNTIVNGLNNAITGDSVTFSTVSGNGNSLSGTSVYDAIGGASITAVSQTRSFLFGDTHSTTSGSYLAAFGTTHTAGSGSHQFAWGSSGVLSGVDYGWVAGRSCSLVDSASPLAAADYASAVGYGATARSFGQRVEANGPLNTTINVQRSRYIGMRRYAHTTGLLSTDIRLNGVDQYILVPTNSVWLVRASVVAALSDGTKYGAWTVDFAARDSSGTLSVLGSPSATTVYDGHSATWAIAPAIRSSPRGITISVSALNGETVDWSATFDCNELSNAW